VRFIVTVLARPYSRTHRTLTSTGPNHRGHASLAKRGLGSLVVPTLNRLVEVGAKGEPTRRRLARDALRAQEGEVVEAFINARLLTSSEIDGRSVVEVAHEALLRQWPPLAEAIERDRERLQLRSELERAAEEWQRSGRHEEYLLPGQRLALARRLTGSAQSAATDLTDVARAFLAASQDRQLLQEAAQRRRTRRAFGGLAGALLVVSALAFIALIQAGRASDQRDTAQAALLVTNALGELVPDPARASCSPWRRMRRSTRRSRRAFYVSRPARPRLSFCCAATREVLRG
jgi:hypothetical protein